MGCLFQCLIGLSPSFVSAGKPCHYIYCAMLQYSKSSFFIKMVMDIHGPRHASTKGPVLEIPTGPSVRGRQLWRRAGNFLLIFLQFYVYDLRFKAWGPTTFRTEFQTLQRAYEICFLFAAFTNIFGVFCHFCCLKSVKMYTKIKTVHTALDIFFLLSMKSCCFFHMWRISKN